LKALVSHSPQRGARSGSRAATGKENATTHYYPYAKWEGPVAARTAASEVDADIMGMDGVDTAPAVQYAQIHMAAALCRGPSVHPVEEITREEDEAPPDEFIAMSDDEAHCTNDAVLPGTDIVVVEGEDGTSCWDALA
jgi:hypothetical protein